MTIDDPGHPEAGFNPERPDSQHAIWMDYRFDSLQLQIEASNRLIEQLTGGGELWCSVCLFIPEDDRPVGWETSALTIINGYLLCEEHARSVVPAPPNSPLSMVRADLRAARVQADLKASQALVEKARRGDDLPIRDLP